MIFRDAVFGRLHNGGSLSSDPGVSKSILRVATVVEY